MSAAASQMPMLHLYRSILKAAKHFPSRKRDRIIAEIKADFHAKKDLKDKEKVAHARQVAERGLEDLQAYLPAQRNVDGGISITLRGATT